MWKVLAYIALFLLSPQVCAAIFEPTPTDKSVELLGMIFGTTVGDIYLGGAPNSALAELMEKFNFVVMVAGLIVVSYAGIMSTINTAQEGTVMGKKWSAVWVPMRSVAGMALMIPAPGSGYSLIQITVMWIIMQGIGAADALWTIVMENLKSGVSAATGTTASSFIDRENAKRLSKQILRYAVCMKHYHKVAETPAATKPSTSEYPLYDLWRSQTEHFDADDGDGDYVANYGSTIKYYMADEMSEPQYSTTLPSANIAGANTKTGAKMEGTVNFGDDGDDSTYASVCGYVQLKARVYDRDLSQGNEDYEPTQTELKSAALEVYYVKQNIISTMLTTLEPLAEKIVDGEFIEQEDETLTNDDYDIGAPYIDNAVNAYVQLSSTLVVPDTQINSLEEYVEGAKLDQAIADGWITAGSYYFTLNKTKESKKYYIAEHPEDIDGTINCIKSDSDAKQSTTSCKPRFVGLNSYDFALLRQSMRIASQIADNAKGTSGLVTIETDTQENPSGDAITLVTQGIGEGLDSMRNMILAIKSSADNPELATDPLYLHMQFGFDLMRIAEWVWLGMIAIGAVLASLAAAAFLSPAPITGTLAFISTILLIVVPVFVALWLFGAGLAIYAPFIPYMIFAVTALGWLLIVVEAIIAAPIIALGLVVPAGDELGKIGAALSLLANIFLRPMLMILGFILASRIYAAIITLVDYGIISVLDEISEGTPLSGIVVMFVYVSFILSLTNTSFSLIYAVPDKILRWIGGQTEHTSIEPVGESRRAFEGKSEGFGKELRGGLDATGKLGKDIADSKAAAGLKAGSGASSTGGGTPAAGGNPPEIHPPGGGGAKKPPSGGTP